MNTDPISEAIALLMRHRDELQVQIDGIDAAVARLRPTTTGRAATRDVSTATKIVPGSLRERILELVSGEDRDYGAEEIVAAVNGADASVRSILSRMVRSGDLVTPARGRYRRSVDTTAEINTFSEDMKEVSDAETAESRSTEHGTGLNL